MFELDLTLFMSYNYIRLLLPSLKVRKEAIGQVIVSAQFVTSGTGRAVVLKSCAGLASKYEVVIHQ